MRAIATAAIALVVGVTPALAQRQDPLTMKYEAEKKAHQDAEKAYNDTMRSTRTTTPAVKNDPWKVVRPEPEKKPEEQKKR